MIETGGVVVDEKRVKLHKLPSGFKKGQAKKALTSLMTHDKKGKKDSLFPDSLTRYLLDIRAFKTPSGDSEFFNVRLPFSPYADPKDLEILLVVRDVKDCEEEQIVGGVKDLLRESKVGDDLKVGQILTFKQLKEEYSTFEAKRALAKSVDVVVAENEVWNMMPKVLGREFIRKKKFPLSIPGRSFKDYDLGEQILYALNKTTVHVSLKGQTSTVVVGHDNLEADALAENVSKIANWLKVKFPGGWRNVKSLSLNNAKDGVPPLVIYLSTGSANDVTKPPTTKKAPREIDLVQSDVSSDEEDDDDEEEMKEEEDDEVEDD